MGTEVNVWCANIGWKWHDNWVLRLQRMVQDSCSIPTRFRCISDHDIAGVETVPFSRQVVTTTAHHSQTRDAEDMLLNSDKPQGCWAKVDVWKYAPVGSLNILLDLDICIVGDLAQLVSKEPAGAKDPRHTESKPWLNGSVLSWQSTEFTQQVYPEKIPYRSYPRGEQEYVQAKLGGFVPLDGVYSYKGHLNGKTRDSLPDDAIIVYFHGHPTPATDAVQQFSWISRTWKGIPRIERVSR